jgi:hypothetical protein
MVTPSNDQHHRTYVKQLRPLAYTQNHELYKCVLLVVVALAVEHVGKHSSVDGTIMFKCIVNVIVQGWVFKF